MIASVLCGLASDWLAAKYPSALIVRELSVGNWGSAMLDIAAITETEIIGIEIKGDGDSATRLQLQGLSYSKAATRMYLLAAPSLEKSCGVKRPSGWGVLGVAGDGSAASPYHLIEPKPWITPSLLPTAPAQLLQCLWKAELLRLGADLRIAVSKKMILEKVIEEIADLVPLRELRPAVCARLRDRDWSYAKGLNGERVRSAA